MSIAMAIYVSEFSFTQLEKVTEHTKVMIESWQVNTYEPKQTSQFFNPSISFTDDKSIYRNNPTKKDYQQHSWLFGGIRR
jgi:hypothetical protein